MQIHGPAHTGIAGLLLAGALASQHAVNAHSPKQAPGSAAQPTELHRALGLLQYVYGDYAMAVDADGIILDEDEFIEQFVILDEVAGILREAGGARAASKDAAALQRQLEAVRDAAAEQRAPAVVQSQVRRLRHAIVRTYELRLAPQRPPRLEQGRVLYQQSCAACHGDDGRARTAIALGLTPAPTDFRSPRLSETLSPYQVFNVVGFGIPGTAMPSFDVLDEDERWDLAFHVVSLRHAPAVREQARDPKQHGLVPELPSLSELASFTDAELGDWFVERGVDAADKNAAVARARRLHESH